MVTAVTGGIAEGKSTVLAYLAELGFATASADAIARSVFGESDVNRQLAIAAGRPYPIAPGELLELISCSSEIRRAVNRVMHPRVLSEIRASGADFVEVPLLLEACLQGQFHQIWVVTCGIDEQRRRLRGRYGEDSDPDRLLATQLPTLAKIPFADEVFRTNKAPAAVRRDVSKALKRRFQIG